MRAIQGSTVATVLASVVVCACVSAPGEQRSTAPAVVVASATTPVAGGTVVPAVALSTATSPPAAASTNTKSVDSKAANADSKITCHTEIPAGSRVGVRVCETAAQREAREASVRAIKDQLSRPAAGCPLLGPGGCADGAL